MTEVDVKLEVCGCVSEDVCDNACGSNKNMK
nr:MAG TPA: hypothetical protein [Bacteriophage sp.]